MKPSAVSAGLLALFAAACTSDVKAPANSPSAAASADQPNTALASFVSTSSAASAIPIKVYKDPNCGCCKAWIQHLEENGFKVEVMDLPDLSAVKQKYRVTSELKACHTGVVNGYTIEGHVPADLILKMLKEKPGIAGLAVPGMPAGSPGMEGMGKEKFDVLTFDRAGKTTVYGQR